MIRGLIDAREGKELLPPRNQRSSEDPEVPKTCRTGASGSRPGPGAMRIEGSVVELPRKKVAGAIRKDVVETDRKAHLKTGNQIRPRRVKASQRR